MQPFIDKVLFIETFGTLAGDLEVLARIQVAGSTLRLLEISVAPADPAATEPGYHVLRGIMEQITGAASAQGFRMVEFEGERINGATAGRRAFVKRRML